MKPVVERYKSRPCSIMIYESNDLEGDKRLANLIVCFESIPVASKTMDIPICMGFTNEKIFNVWDNSVKGLKILW